MPGEEKNIPKILAVVASDKSEIEAFIAEAKNTPTVLELQAETDDVTVPLSNSVFLTSLNSESIKIKFSEGESVQVKIPKGSSVLIDEATGLVSHIKLNSAEPLIIPQVSEDGVISDLSSEIIFSTPKIKDFDSRQDVCANFIEAQKAKPTVAEYDVTEEGMQLPFEKSIFIIDSEGRKTAAIFGEGMNFKIPVPKGSKVLVDSETGLVSAITLPKDSSISFPQKLGDGSVIPLTSDEISLRARSEKSLEQIWKDGGKLGHDLSGGEIALYTGIVAVGVPAGALVTAYSTAWSTGIPRSLLARTLVGSGASEFGNSMGLLGKTTNFLDNKFSFLERSQYSGFRLMGETLSMDRPARFIMNTTGRLTNWGGKAISLGAWDEGTRLGNWLLDNNYYANKIHATGVALEGIETDLRTQAKGLLEPSAAQEVRKLNSQIKDIEKGIKEAEETQNLIKKERLEGEKARLELKAKEAETKAAEKIEKDRAKLEKKAEKLEKKADKIAEAKQKKFDKAERVRTGNKKASAPRVSKATVEAATKPSVNTPVAEPSVSSVADDVVNVADDVVPNGTAATAVDDAVQAVDNIAPAGNSGATAADDIVNSARNVAENFGSEARTFESAAGKGGRYFNMSGEPVVQPSGIRNINNGPMQGNAALKLDALDEVADAATGLRSSMSVAHSSAKVNAPGTNYNPQMAVVQDGAEVTETIVGDAKAAKKLNELLDANPNAPRRLVTFDAEGNIGSARVETVKPATVTSTADVVTDANRALDAAADIEMAAINSGTAIDQAGDLTRGSRLIEGFDDLSNIRFGGGGNGGGGTIGGGSSGSSSLKGSNLLRVGGQTLAVTGIVLAPLAVATELDRVVDEYDAALPHDKNRELAEGATSLTLTTAGVAGGVATGLVAIGAVASAPIWLIGLGIYGAADGLTALVTGESISSRIGEGVGDVFWGEEPEMVTPKYGCPVPKASDFIKPFDPCADHSKARYSDATSEEVIYLQQKLNKVFAAEGIRIAEDGVFGPDTMKAMIKVGLTRETVKLFGYNTDPKQFVDMAVEGNHKFFMHMTTQTPFMNSWNEIMDLADLVEKHYKPGSTVKKEIVKKEAEVTKKITDVAVQKDVSDSLMNFAVAESTSTNIPNIRMMDPELLAKPAKGPLER